MIAGIKKRKEIQWVKLDWQTNLPQNSFSCMFHASLNHKEGSYEGFGGHCFRSSYSLSLIIWLTINSGWAFTCSPEPRSSNFAVVTPQRRSHIYHERSVTHKRFSGVSKAGFQRLEHRLRAKQFSWGSMVVKGWPWGDRTHTRAGAYVVGISHKCQRREPLSFLTNLLSCAAEGKEEPWGLKAVSSNNKNGGDLFIRSVTDSWSRCVFFPHDKESWLPWSTHTIKIGDKKNRHRRQSILVGSSSRLWLPTWSCLTLLYIHLPFGTAWPVDFKL